MSPRADRLSLRFAMFAGRQSGRVLDVGCGTGVATLAALMRGARVIAVDPDQAVLEALLSGVPACHYGNLSVRVGALPALQLMPASLDAIHASRVLHLLHPMALRAAIVQFSRWLRPGGRLFCSVFNPGGAGWEPLHVEYARRVARSELWPGYFVRSPTGDTSACEPGAPVHLLDERVLRRELADAGFHVEEAFSYALSWAPEQTCTAVIARVPSD